MQEVHLRLKLTFLLSVNLRRPSLFEVLHEIPLNLRINKVWPWLGQTTPCNQRSQLVQIKPEMRMLCCNQIRCASQQIFLYQFTIMSCHILYDIRHFCFLSSSAPWLTGIDPVIGLTSTGSYQDWAESCIPSWSKIGFSFVWFIKEYKLLDFCNRNIG